MDRRDFLKSSSLTALSTGLAAQACAAAPSFVPKTHELVLASPWPASSGGYADDVHCFARRLERAAGGRLKLHLITSCASSASALASGDAGMHFGLEHDNVQHHPAFGYFAGLPCAMGMSFAALETWLVAGGGDGLWDELCEDFGIKTLLAGHTGPMAGLWSSARPLMSLNDLAAQPVFTRGLASEVAKGLGADVANLTAETVAGELATGHIRAAEWGNAAQCLAAGIPRCAKFCTTTGLTPAGSALSISVKRSVWHRLGDELQIALRLTAAAEARRSVADAEANDAILRRALAEVHAVQFYDMPRDIWPAAVRVSEAVVADIATRGALSARINASYIEVRRLEARKPARNTAIS